MKAEEKQKTANVLTERAVWLRIGLLPIKVKPLTLGQIYELGEYSCQLESEDLDMKARVLASAEMLARYKSARMMQEIFIIAAFRKKWKRWLFRRYILKRLTVFKFQKIIEVITDAFTANFFLTSIIFLNQTNKITEPNPMIARGQPSEE